MKRVIPLGIVLSAMGLLTAPASAGSISASGVITAKPDGPNFDYTIALTNTSGAGNDSIETFWFAWVPFKNLLPGTLPSNILTPSGWTEVTTGGTVGPFGLQWETTTAALAPGSSLTFGFTSNLTPAQIAGNSAGIPVVSSTVYSGIFPAGDDAVFVLQSVPEPSTLTLGIVGLASLAALRLRRKGAA